MRSGAHGVGEKQIEIVRVPGAFDIPIVARKLALSHRYQGLIALGAVIRGQTPHFDYVAGECAGGIARIALESGVPIAFGVLTTDTVEQAVDRAGGKAGNKGADAALVALEMANPPAPPGHLTWQPSAPPRPAPLEARRPRQGPRRP